MTHEASVSTGEFAEEVGFVHAVFERFAPVDKDNGDFVGELTTEFFVAVDIDVSPGEAAAAVKFGEGLFDNFAEVTSFAGIYHDLAGLGHWVSLARAGGLFQRELTHCALDTSRTYVRSG
jgi:hypothetical protein